MKPDQPPKPSQKQDEWSELEQDSTFQNMLLTSLSVRISDKKFGAEFMNEYEGRAFVRGYEDEDGNAQIPTDIPGLEEGIVESMRLNEDNPLIPEVEEFKRKLKYKKSVSELLDFAKTEGVELTEEDMRQAKEYALNACYPEKEEGGLES